MVRTTKVKKGTKPVEVVIEKSPRYLTLEDVPLVEEEPLQTDEENLLEASETYVEVCPCIDYEGQFEDCPIHEFRIKCMHCNCVDTVVKVKELPPLEGYHCNLCGKYSKRNLVTGEYLKE